jgi:hypothetical protein
MRIVSNKRASAHAQHRAYGTSEMMQVKATPHVSYHHKGIMAYFRTGANKGKLEAALRRFYNTEKYPLPEKTLYKSPISG